MLRSLILCSVFLGFFSACSSTVKDTTGTPIAFDVVVDSAASSPLELSAASCRSRLEQDFEARAGWFVVKRGSQARGQAEARRVKVFLDDAQLRIVAKDGATVRLLSWLFLGPVYFWMADHRFELSCQASYQFASKQGDRSTRTQGRRLSASEYLNFHQWSGRIEWYLLSNFVPPYLSSPDSETLTESLFQKVAKQLADDIEKQLKAPPKESPLLVLTKISPEIDSPVKVLRPRLGDRVKDRVEVELALVKPETLVSLSMAGPSLKGAELHKAKSLKQVMSVKNGELRLGFQEQGQEPKTIVLSFEELSAKKALAKTESKQASAKRFEVQEVRGLPKGFQLLSPELGVPVSGESLTILLAVTDPKLNTEKTELQIGDKRWRLPVKGRRIQAVLPIKNGRGQIQIRRGAATESCEVLLQPLRRVPMRLTTVEAGAVTVRSPKVGAIVKGPYMTLKLELKDSAQVKSLRVGKLVWRGPFKSKTLTVPVVVREGEALIKITNLKGQRSQVKLSFSPS